MRNYLTGKERLLVAANHGKTKRATLQKRNVIFVPKNEM